MADTMPRTTLAACARETCDGCEIEGEIACTQMAADMAEMVLPAAGFFIPFLAGMLKGGHRNALRVWLGLTALFFGYVEIKILCSHCPRYAEEGRFLKCYAHWGFPKIPRYDPGPMSALEKAVWLVCVSALVTYHVPFFIRKRQWRSLLLTTLAAAAFVFTVYRTHCGRCPNLSCPGNHVPEHVREIFSGYYPGIAGAW